MRETAKEVFKFGGASIADAPAIQHLGALLKVHQHKDLMVVVSALGKTTNALEEVVALFCAHQRSEAQDSFAQIKGQHFSLCNALFGDDAGIQATLNDLCVEAEWLLEDDLQDAFDYVYDQIVVLGELMSSRIFAHYLCSAGLSVTWIDARGIVITDETYRRAEIDLPASQAAYDSQCGLAKHWILTQGFIGGSPDNNSTTLGREGSDLSAVLFAVLSKANQVTLWKDVDGIFTKDPHQFGDAERIEDLSYDEALLIMESGAKVVHPEALRMAREYGISIRVRSFTDSDQDGGSVIG
ncbi:MAG: aspartate kinase [Saprospiraceae bacterium]|nr:aspartate kinase [Saprospiraceae bacterium]